MSWPEVPGSAYAGQLWAVEVELTPKPLARTTAIMSGLVARTADYQPQARPGPGPRYHRVIYLTAPAARSVVDRAAAAARGGRGWREPGASAGLGRGSRGGRRRRGSALTCGPGTRVATLPGMEIVTGSGPARVDLDEPGHPAFLLVLTHGAGGGVDSKDLLAARQAGLGLGGAVARVLQPYRVRGARAPGSADRQDAAWLEVIDGLRRRFPAIPLVQGGRSNGARLACRTARAAGARAVVALAFPVHPPGRPERTRIAELRGAGADVLVVNGARDPFGIPARADAARVVVLPGETHALARHPDLIRQEVMAWLGEVLGLTPGKADGKADGKAAG